MKLNAMDRAWYDEVNERLLELEAEVVTLMEVVQQLKDKQNPKKYNTGEKK